MFSRIFSRIAHLRKSSWTFWVGYRYLRSKKNSRFLSFITLISILGVALGVMSMIVVLSVMDGFESELKKRLMATDLHVLISPTAKVPGFDRGWVTEDRLSTQEILKSIQQEKPNLAKEVLQFWPIVSTEAILRSGKKVTGAVVKGVSQQRLFELRSKLTETSEPELLFDPPGSPASPDFSREERVRLPGIFLGKELSDEMGLIAGDRVTLISPTETEGPLGNIPRMKRFVVEGIYRSGVPEQELHTVFAAEGSVRSFIRKSAGVTQWELTVRDFDRAPELAKVLKQKLPDFKIQDWIELNTHLFASLRLERIAMGIALVFIIIVASFNIVTTLTLMVLEKKKEISILRAMGAQNSEVASIFLGEGIYIGWIGVISGVLVGGLFCVLLKRYEFIQLPEVYYDRTLPVTFNGMYYVGVALIALIVVLLACLYPSRRASKILPLEGIRGS